MTLKGKHNLEGGVDVRLSRSQMFTIITAFVLSVIVPLAISYSDYKVFRNTTETEINKQKKFNNNVVNAFKQNNLNIDEFATINQN